MQDMRTFISKGFEEIPNAVIVTDPIGVIVFANSHAKSWFKENDNLVGYSVHNLFESSVFSQLNDKISSALIEALETDVELQLNHRDILIHCSPFLVDENSDSGLMLTFSDITQIREQQREKNQLIDFLSHDVRSPLVSQLAMLDSIGKGNETLSPALIAKLGAHAQRSLNLSDQFLQITRAEQTTEQNFYEFDLVNTIENSIDSLDAQAKVKNIEIKFEEFDPVWLKGNAELMERAITNIISNSIKYSADKTSITINLTTNNNTVDIKIIDQGYGIEPNELPHIFKRFHRQRSSEVSGNKGAGLGLNFVKVVIDKHQGEIKVISEKNKGTTFNVILPSAMEESN
jgi:signal transduction histidine kinase